MLRCAISVTLCALPQLPKLSLTACHNFQTQSGKRNIHSLEKNDVTISSFLSVQRTVCRITTSKREIIEKTGGIKVMHVAIVITAVQ